MNPFYWSEEDQAYFYSATNRRVPLQQLNRALERVITRGAEQMRDMTMRLQNGELSLDQWQTMMASEIKMLHTGAAAFGRGGWAQMSQGDWGWTGLQIRAQYAFLRNFAQDIATGKQPLDGRLVARAAQYAEAARATQRGMQRRMAIRTGQVEERNILGLAEQHCSECPGLSALGWVPIGTLPPIGGRACRVQCVCQMIYRDAQELPAA